VAGAMILVHGAWRGPWVWDRVTPLLEAAGIETHTVDLPSVGEGDIRADMYDDAAAVRAAVEAVGRSAVVVGHSYGGFPVTEGAAAPTVVGLVYVAAFMPDEGETAVGLLGGVPPDWWIFSEDGRTILPEPVDAPVELYDAEAAALIARARPLSAAVVEQPVRQVAWRRLPSVYVVCEADERVPPATQESIATRADRVERLATGHWPMLSAPEKLTRILVEAATRSDAGG
jgi:pimeloyl-ACP methyl ester carboxylesterase